MLEKADFAFTHFATITNPISLWMMSAVLPFFIIQLLTNPILTPVDPDKNTKSYPMSTYYFIFTFLLHSLFITSTITLPKPKTNKFLLRQTTRFPWWMTKPVVFHMWKDWSFHQPYLTPFLKNCMPYVTILFVSAHSSLRFSTLPSGITFRIILNRLSNRNSDKTCKTGIYHCFLHPPPRKIHS